MTSPLDAPEDEHPSYGTIATHRVSGRTHLFDSEAEHQHFISITISRATVQRLNTTNYIHPTTELIEVDLSEAQWAHFVSSMNLGAGTPCTLRRVKGEKVPEVPTPKSGADTFGNDMRDILREYEAHLGEIDTLVTKMRQSATPSKKDLAALSHQLSIVRGRFHGNAKFVADQFGEHIEETMLKARQEIEAYFINRVQQLGLAAQAEQMPVSLDTQSERLERTSQELAKGNPEAWNHE